MSEESTLESILFTSIGLINNGLIERNTNQNPKATSIASSILFIVKLCLYSCQVKEIYAINKPRDNKTAPKAGLSR
jgi:hypothetical protein